MPLPKDPIKAEETRRKMSRSHTGKTMPNETRMKISGALKGKIKTYETRKKLSEALKGEKNPNFGKHIPEETKIKMREAQCGENHSQYGKPKSEETRRKIGEANRDPSDVTRKRMSAARKGHTPSEETRKKISDTTMGGHWYGNIRYYGDAVYCELFNEDLKERTRAYWGYKCAECGKKQEENISNSGKHKKLHVHHVHYNKKTCCDGSPRDLVPLCNECHGKTNHNREYWEDRFTKLIYSHDPTGKCFFTKEEFYERNVQTL